MNGTKIVKPSGNPAHPKCSVEFCINYARSPVALLCEKHYMRQYRHGDVLAGFTRDSTVPYSEWFWKQVQKTDTCWLWRRGRDSHGYGTLTREDGVADRAHRLAWILAFGEIADGLFVCHKCDNPPCCRPGHLFLGSQKDNMQDAAKKGRTAHGERRSYFTEDDVIAIRVARHEGLTYREIAERFHSTPLVVRAIAVGTNWRRAGGPIAPVSHPNAPDRVTIEEIDAWT